MTMVCLLATNARGRDISKSIALSLQQKLEVRKKSASGSFIRTTSLVVFVDMEIMKLLTIDGECITLSTGSIIATISWWSVPALKLAPQRFRQEVEEVAEAVAATVTKARAKAKVKAKASRERKWRRFLANEV